MALTALIFPHFLLTTNHRRTTVSTPHINAPVGAFAETVLLPGDPLRAKHIATTFFENPQEITNVRGMLGFTGLYQGKKVSVMGTGMGIPSCSIYAKELITEYGVKALIRVGTAGAVSSTLKLRDVVIATGASTDSSTNRTRFMGYDYAAVADFGLAVKAFHYAKQHDIPVHVGSCFSSDLFYSPMKAELQTIFSRMNILCVEMEAAGLYGVATEYNAHALAVLTISDHLLTHEALPPADRQTSFNAMVDVALGCL